MSHFIAYYRTRLSQLFGLLFFFLVMFTSKKLDLVAPEISGVLFLIGCALVGIAIVGRLWCAQYIAGYKDNTLVREGPYSMCRNPLYFFSFLGTIGVGLCTESLALTAFLIVCFGLLYRSIIHTEETKLIRIFGEPYADYLREVPRFLPNPHLFHEPRLYEVVPGVFRHAAGDALWFVVAIGVMEFIEALQDTGLLPTLFSLY